MLPQMTNNTCTCVSDNLVRISHKLLISVTKVISVNWMRKVGWEKWRFSSLIYSCIKNSLLHHICNCLSSMTIIKMKCYQPCTSVSYMHLFKDVFKWYILLLQQDKHKVFTKSIHLTSVGYFVKIINIYHWKSLQ